MGCFTMAIRGRWLGSTRAGRDQQARARRRGRKLLVLVAGLHDPRRRPLAAQLWMGVPDGVPVPRSLRPALGRVVGDRTFGGASG